MPDHLQLAVGICGQEVLMAGMASFPGARQKVEIVGQAEKGTLRHDCWRAGKKRIQLRSLELRDDSRTDIFKVRGSLQSQIHMLSAEENRSFVPEGEVHQRQGRPGGV